VRKALSVDGGADKARKPRVRTTAAVGIEMISKKDETEKNMEAAGSGSDKMKSNIYFNGPCSWMHVHSQLTMEKGEVVFV